MRVRLTCEWRSSLVTQEDLPPMVEGQPAPEPPWCAPGARVEGRLVRLRALNKGYALARDLADGLQKDHPLAVLRDNGSRAWTAPVTDYAQKRGYIEVYTSNGRYRLEVLPVEPPSAKTPRRRGC